MFFGGPVGIRTPDLCNANAALYQLSYRPMEVIIDQFEATVQNVSRETFSFSGAPGGN